ncbi:hypothetical protein AKJ16_DCAP25926, partial [Drosera capensis]
IDSSLCQTRWREINVVFSFPKCLLFFDPFSLSLLCFISSTIAVQIRDLLFDLQLNPLFDDSRLNQRHRSDEFLAGIGEKGEMSEGDIVSGVKKELKGSALFHLAHILLCHPATPSHYKVPILSPALLSPGTFSVLVSLAVMTVNARFKPLRFARTLLPSLGI